VLHGDPAGCRLGLGVLERNGVAAWMRAWRTTAPEAAQRPVVPGVPAAGDELVGVLATMALACLETE